MTSWIIGIRGPATILAALLIGSVVAAWDRISPADEQTSAATPITVLNAPEGLSEDSVRFTAVDVVIDSGREPLAVWQLRVDSQDPGVEIVGIEGGDHQVWQNPPYYDPRALSNDQIVLAAFHAEANTELPSGRQRVARLHLQLSGNDHKQLQTQVQVLASDDGTPITAEVLLQESD